MQLMYPFGPVVNHRDDSLLSPRCVVHCITDRGNVEGRIRSNCDSRKDKSCVGAVGKPRSTEPGDGTRVSSLDVECSVRSLQVDDR